MVTKNTSIELNHSQQGMMRAKLQSGMRKLGSTGMVGIGLFVMCGAFYFSAIKTSETRLQTLRDNIAQFEKSEANPGDLAEVNLTQAEQLAVFYSSFPTKSSIPESLKKIYKAAANQRLDLDRANYKSSRRDSEKMSRYQITLPIRGRYSNIHKFLVEVLKDVPNASLDHVLFERKKIGDLLVNASVVLVLHLVPEQ
jgi:Tfp pilus assembly protein PilO